MTSGGSVIEFGDIAAESGGLSLQLCEQFEQNKLPSCSRVTVGEAFGILDVLHFGQVSAELSASTQFDRG